MRPMRRTAKATTSSSEPTWRTTFKPGSPTSSSCSRRPHSEKANKFRLGFLRRPPVFDVPTALVNIFNRDLKAAGIAKRDERGRTLDVHALRTTFGTLLGRGGVSLRSTQAAMRHSDPKRTANVYTEPKLLDVQGALDALPSLPINARPTVEQERARAAGTDGQDPCAAAPLVALNQRNERQTAFIGDKTKAESPNSIGPARLDVNQGFSGDSTIFQRVEASALSVCPAGLEPATSSFGGILWRLPKTPEIPSICRVYGTSTQFASACE
jgi:hypothetical protein